MAGEPLPPSGLTATAASSSQIDLAWTDNAAAVAGINEVQTITFDATPIAGTFTLTYDGQTTDAIAYDADAAAIVAALEATAAFEVGDVAVDRTGNVITITYQGGLAAMSLPEITADASLLKQAAETIGIAVTQSGNAPVDSVPSINTTTSAVTGVNEVQTITFDATPDSGSWTINGETVASGASAAWSDVEAAIEAAGLPCAVTGTFGGGFVVTFDSQAPVSALTVVTSSLLDSGSTAVGNTVTETTAGVTSVHQVDTVTFDSTAVAGSMTLDGNSLAYDTNASTLTISGAMASGTPASGSILITWDDDQSHSPVSVATSSLLSVVGRQQILTITLDDSPTEGSWRVLTGGSPVGDLLYTTTNGYVVGAAMNSAVLCTGTGPDGGPHIITTTNNTPGLTWTAASNSEDRLRKAVGITINTDTEGSPQQWDDLGSEVHRSTDGVSYSLLVDLGANMESWPDATCSASTEYWYKVRAYNEGGDSAFSNADSDTTFAAEEQGGEQSVIINAILPAARSAAASPFNWGI